MDRTRANYAPLTPVSFLRRSAEVYPQKPAVIHGDTVFTYAQFHARVARFASALARRGIERGHTVAFVAPNVPALLEAHYAVPGLGAILNALNYRLDARTIAFCLDHGEAKVLVTDREFSPVVSEALKLCKAKPLVVDIDDPLASGGERIGALTYEELLGEGDPAFALPGPEDEWDSMSLLYTSGTTGDPKGVVYHHRGGYLNALGNALMFSLSPQSVYLWTLPMFHCNGWTYTWAVTAVGATHVCLRKVDPALIFPAIREHRVTHLCGAPIVLNLLVHAPESVKLKFDHRVEVATGGAAPPSAIIAAMEKMGFRVTHLYGLTESYGRRSGTRWASTSGRCAWRGRAFAIRRSTTFRWRIPRRTFPCLRTARPSAS
jgi:fatty-acyl-CoA synthase